MDSASGGSGGALEALATVAVDGGSSNGLNSSHGSPLSTDLCIDESGWYVCFYPRDAMLARVFAIATCLSVRPSVCHTPVLCLAERKQDREMYTI